MYWMGQNKVDCFGAVGVLKPLCGTKVICDCHFIEEKLSKEAPS